MSMKRSEEQPEKKIVPVEADSTDDAAIEQEVPPESDASDQNQLLAVQLERDDLLARLQRVSADYLNYQKRVQRDIEEAREYSNASVIREILSVLDDLERAIEHARSNHPSDDPLLVGTELVYAKALEVLKRFGLQPIAAQGEMFDPNFHEALMKQPTSEVPPMTVTAILQKGYTLKGRMIRPAKVVIATAPPDEETSPQESSEEAQQE